MTSTDSSLGFAVFVSYSRKDSQVVRPIVDVIRASGLPVFRDEDSIPPGKRWRLEVAAAIETCRLVLIFWCSHAAQSSEVQSEYEKAVQLKKDVVPVLLDRTPMPEELGQFQAIDLSRALGAHEVGIRGYHGYDLPVRVPAERETQDAADQLARWIGSRFPRGE